MQIGFVRVNQVNLHLLGLLFVRLVVVFPETKHQIAPDSEDLVN